MGTRRSAGWRLASFIVGLGLIASACGGDSETSGDAQPEADPATAADDGADPWDELVAAARAEGQLVFYTSTNEPPAEALATAFEEKYGISVEFIRLSSSDLAPRFLSEAEAGLNAVDVLLNTDSPEGEAGFYDQVSDQGLIIDLEEADIPGYPWDYPEEWMRGSRVVTQILPWLFAYNTDIISDPPTTWPELLEPRFTDLVLMGDVSSVASAGVWATVLEEYGEEWFDGFREQNPRPFSSAAPAAEALAAGEGGVAMPSVGSLVAAQQEAGAPVDFVVPEDVTTGVEIALAIVDPERSPNPNAARLFTAFVMSEEGQTAFNDFPAVSSPTDPASLPEGYVTPPAGAAQMRQELEALLGL